VARALPRHAARATTPLPRPRQGMRTTSPRRSCHVDGALWGTGATSSQ
jgi:hypothetical protein